MRSFRAVLFATSITILAVDAHADVGVESASTPISPAAKRTSQRIVGAGALTFGLAYMPMAILGFGSMVDSVVHLNLLCSDCSQHDAAALIIPIAGPMMYANNNARDDWLGKPTSAERALLITDGVLQLSGLVTMIAASIYSLSKSEPPPRVQANERGFTLEPSMTAGRFGVDAVVRF